MMLGPLVLLSLLITSIYLMIPLIIFAGLLFFGIILKIKEKIVH